MNPVDVLEEVKDYSVSSIGSQVIVPDMVFSCNGTITGLTVNLTENKENESINAGNHTGDKQDGYNNGGETENDEDETESDEDETESDEVEGSNDTDSDGEDEGDNGNKDGEEKNEKDEEKRDTDSIKNFPSIQIWRPLNSKTYTRVGQYTICIGDIKVHGNSTLAEVSLTANKSISFQPDDIIGYYVPPSSPYSILNIHTMEGSSYYVNTNTTLEQFAVNESSTGSHMLPIIQVMFGK